MKTTALTLSLLALLVAYAPAQDQSLVLRRVYFTPAGRTDRKLDPLLREIPRMLASRITSLEPIVILADPAEAHSIVTTTIEPGKKNFIHVTVRLTEKETTVRSAEADFKAAAPEPKRVKQFINDAARDFAPAMGKVTPEVRTLTVTLDEKTKAKVEKIEFAEAMATENEITLWTGSVTKAPATDGSGMQAIVYLGLPVLLTYTHYFDKYSGLSVLFLFEYNDQASFSAYQSGPDKIWEKSNNIFLLPGVGWTVRSLGRLSTTFSVNLLVGAVWIEAVDTLTYFLMAPGETTWVFYSLLNLNLALCWNITPYFSLSAHTGFSLNLLAIIGGISQADLGFFLDYEADMSMLQYQLLGIGASLRF